MGRFKYLRQAQRFLSVHDQTTTTFRRKRHRLPAASYSQSRLTRSACGTTMRPKQLPERDADLGHIATKQPDNPATRSLASVGYYRREHI